MESLQTQTLVLLHLLLLSITASEATEFVFNTNFNSSNLTLFGDSTIQSSILSLTNDSTTFSMGRALFPSKIPKKNDSLSFWTSFIFSLAPIHGFQQGHGFAFVLVPSPGLAGASPAQHLGLFNRTNDGRSTNHVAAVEFDVFQNEEFNDIDDNHVGLNLNSLASVASSPAGYWGGEDGDVFKPLDLNNGANYQVWIDYKDSVIDVSMTVSGRARPRRPLIREAVNLSRFLAGESYVGFTAATGQLVESHRILAWSFSGKNSSIGDALVTRGLPSFAASRGSVFASRGFVVGVCVGCAAVVGLILAVFVVRKRRKSRREYEVFEDWETEFWPHRIGYKEIRKATQGFSERNVIGFGGNGRVYRGVMGGGVEVVAVKRISVGNEQGVREFLAEISSLGRLKHRNLVGLKGWCKREKGSLILVYEYMQNGSLDKRVFECDESLMLSWEERVKVLRDVARGVLYLHEGWELKVLHRDIKASNVLLDKEMNARLGDFGLAKMHNHGQLANSTRVVGTVGYMAPEVVQTGRVSVQTDVFGFGVLVLEVVSGRRPVRDGMPGLVEWVWGLVEAGELGAALDERLKGKSGVDMREVERVLCLGLACVSHDPNGRPSMAQVVKFLEGKIGESDGHGEFEEEGMEMKLLEKMIATAAASASLHKFRRNDGGRGVHPTFEEVRDSISSSVSLSDSDLMRTGR